MLDCVSWLPTVQEVVLLRLHELGFEREMRAWQMQLWQRLQIVRRLLWRLWCSLFKYVHKHHIKVRINKIRTKILLLGGESSNLLWIFEEILRNRNTNLIPSEGAPGRSQSTRSGNSPSHSILEDFPTRLEASPLLIEEMKRERAERVAELLQARRRTGLQEEMTFYDVTNVSNDFKSNQHNQRHSFTWQKGRQECRFKT